MKYTMKIECLNCETLVKEIAVSKRHNQPNRVMAFCDCGPYVLDAVKDFIVEHESCGNKSFIATVSRPAVAAA